jgi:LacI family transcriptional regulator
MATTRRIVTRDEIARAAEVSAATVSYVVNNGPRPVASETRTKVLEAIERLGYKPNAIARNLRLRRSSTIGLIIPDINNPYFAQVARGTEQMASENGLTTVLCHSNYSLERELHYVEVLHSERAAGVIWFPATHSPEPGIRMVEYGMPLVVLDRMVEGVQVPEVVANNFLGGFQATQHLIELGHRVIGCIARPTELHHSSERVRGFREALADHGIECNESLIARGGFLLADGYQAAGHILRSSSRPTAIFAYNDFMAIGALRAAYDLGIKVPDDVSIVGFDDIPEAAFTCPALTTVSQPKLEMGRKGVNLLLEVINQGSAVTEYSSTLPVELVVRESTGPHH